MVIGPAALIVKFKTWPFLTTFDHHCNNLHSLFGPTLLILAMTVTEIREALFSAL